LRESEVLVTEPTIRLSAFLFGRSTGSALAGSHEDTLGLWGRWRSVVDVAGDRHGRTDSLGDQNLDLDDTLAGFSQHTDHVTRLDG
jgi:hypothetical protein